MFQLRTALLTALHKKSLFSIIMLASLAIALPAETNMPEMLFIEGGSYWMGSNEGAFAANEKAYQVTISSYYIAKTETTQELWASVMGSNPSRFQGKDRPVEYVSWYDAVRFCNALSKAEGLEEPYTISGSSVQWNREANGYRLPTEAEWEYAARGGPLGAITETALTRAYYSGGNNPSSVAWYDANSGRTTKSVATKEANELGLYDMSGNVWEWCWDWYNNYPETPQENPAGPEVSSGRRVMRGGAWFTPVNLIRTTYRYWNAPSFKVNSVGFRVARNVE